MSLHFSDFRVDERDNSPGAWLLAGVSGLFIAGLIFWSITASDEEQTPPPEVAHANASGAVPTGMRVVSGPASAGAALVPAVTSSVITGERAAER